MLLSVRTHPLDQPLNTQGIAGNNLRVDFVKADEERTVRVFLSHPLHQGRDRFRPHLLLGLRHMQIRMGMGQGGSNPVHGQAIHPDQSQIGPFFLHPLILPSFAEK